jgi:hypothetical protein
MTTLPSYMDCEMLLSSLFVVCAFIGWFAIHRKSQGTLIDVERWAHRVSGKENPTDDFTIRWYIFRICSVVLVIGGFMHGHRIVKRLWRSLKGSVWY